MRRADREITEKEKIAGIIEECKVIRLAMTDEKGLYLVPVNFGYACTVEGYVFYIHSAREGRKAAALKKGMPVAFEMDCGHRLTEAQVPCGYGYAYKSIIGMGTPVLLEEPEEKIRALKALMRHQTGKEFEFSDDMVKGTAVFAVQVQELSAKSRV